MRAADRVAGMHRKREQTAMRARSVKGSLAGQRESDVETMIGTAVQCASAFAQMVQDGGPITAHLVHELLFAKHW